MKKYPLSQLKKGDVITCQIYDSPIVINSINDVSIIFYVYGDERKLLCSYNRATFRNSEFQYAPGHEPANPPPVPNESRPVSEFAIEILKQRNEMGTRKYGTPLQVGNGRSFQDAIEECADLFVYLVKEKLEREAKEAKWKAEIGKYREALQALYDCQNGPPLIRDKAEWEAAMGAAVELLGKNLEL